MSAFGRAERTDHRRVVSRGRIHHCRAAKELARERHFYILDIIREGKKQLTVDSKGSVDGSKSIKRLRGLRRRWRRVRWRRWQNRRLVADWSSVAHSLLVLNRLIVKQE